MSTLSEGLAGRGGPLRYAAAGLVNSGVGYAVILALGLAGAAPFAANAGGFAAGFAVSLFLASAYTFGPARRPAAPVRYAAGFLICYALNLAVVAACLASGLPAALSQGGGVAAYAACFYLACRWWVYGGEEDLRADLRLAASVSRGAWQARPGLVAALACAPIAAAASLAANPSDVVWQMWIARQLAGGADLYTQLSEVNPPLWFWMAVPVHQTADAFGLSPLLAINVAVAALCVLSFGLCASLTRGWAATEGGGADRLVVLSGCFFGLLLFPLIHFAQREHLALIGALPYVLLAVRRAEGRAFSLVGALVVGALAGCGLLLKHYFVLLPLALEAWRMARGGTLRGTFRPEALAPGLSGAAYAVAMLALSRDYFTQMVPLIRLAYDGYEIGLLATLLAPFSLACLVTAGAAAAGAFQMQESPARLRLTGLLIGFAVFFLAYAVQAKGFAYHLIPLAGFVACAGGLAMLRADHPRVRFVAGAGLFSLVSLAAVHDPDHDLSFDTYPYDEAGIGAGTRVLTLSWVASPSLPALEARGAVWTSRSLGLWPMASAAMAHERGDAALAAKVTDHVAREVAQDARCNPPDVLLADSSLSRAIPAFEGDVMGALRRHPETAEVMAAFTLAAERGPLQVLRRTAELAPPADPSACRPIH